MNDYILSCCSTVDLSEEHLKKIDVNHVCFHFTLDGKEYPDDLGKSIPFQKFYQMLANGCDAKTSQVNADEFITYFTPFLEKGLDILHLSTSSGISGVYNSALIAQKELKQKFPERKIYVVDSLGGSSGYGLMMDKLSELKRKGNSIDEVRDWAEKNKRKVQHWFFSTDLSFFIKGGRISKTMGFVGTILKICPLMNVDKEGKLTPRMKIRTREKAIQEIVNKMELYAEDGLDYSGKCYISQSACLKDAQAVADLIEEKFKKLNGKVEINSIGTVVGSHCGPGTVALYYWGTERND